jgi:hypothetical protein
VSFAESFKVERERKRERKREISSGKERKIIGSSTRD